MNNENKKSITQQIKRSFIGVFIFMLFGFISIFISGKIAEIYYDEFIQMNQKVAKLPILINKSDSVIQNYYLDFDNNKLEEYKKYNLEIESILYMLDKNIEKDTSVEDYVRTIKNMHNYQKNHVKKINKKSELTPEFYEDISFLKKRFIGMNRQAELMTLEFFNYSSKKYSQYNIHIRNIERNIVVFVFIISLLLISLELRFIKKFFLLINKLVDVSENLSIGKFDIPDLKEDKYMEFNSLGNTFNKLKKSIVDYIEQVKEKSQLEIQIHKDKLMLEHKDKLINETKLKSLQMQMNPHFLFNTLNMIGRTAMLSDSKLTNQLIEAISQILRFNLENDRSLITLDEEIYILEKYIFIQENRFKYRLKIELENKCKKKDILIPPMMIQPIVENAILHGISELDQDAIVKISISTKEDYLQIDVFDNGIGMDKNKINEIITKKNKLDNNKSIGIANVIERLNFFYGNKEAFEIRSNIGEGTTVSFKFPIVEIEER